MDVVLAWLDIIDIFWICNSRIVIGHPWMILLITFLMVPSHSVSVRHYCLMLFWVRKTKEYDHESGQGYHHLFTPTCFSLWSIWNRDQSSHTPHHLTMWATGQKSQDTPPLPCYLLQIWQLVSQNTRLFFRTCESSKHAWQKNSIQRGIAWLCGHSFVFCSLYPQSPLHCSPSYAGLRLQSLDADIRLLIWLTEDCS